MFGRLFLLFLIIPMVDLMLLVSVGSRIGLGPTILLVVLTAAVGSWLARREGTAAWQRVQTKLTTGGIPGPELVDGLVILVAGTLLLTPGFLTDVVGLLGLFPPTRALARKALRARFEQSVTRGHVHIATGPSVFGGFGPMPGAMPGPRPPMSLGIEDAEVIDDGSGARRAPEADRLG